MHKEHSLNLRYIRTLHQGSSRSRNVYQSQKEVWQQRWYFIRYGKKWALWVRILSQFAASIFFGGFPFLRAYKEQQKILGLCPNAECNILSRALWIFKIYLEHIKVQHSWKFMTYGEVFSQMTVWSRLLLHKFYLGYFKFQIRSGMLWTKHHQYLFGTYKI